MTPRYLLLILVALGAAWLVPTPSEARHAASPADGLRGAPDGPSATARAADAPSVSESSTLSAGAPSAAGGDNAVSEPIGSIAAQPGAVGSALIGGWATWYRDGPGLYAAAGPELRAAFGSWRGTVVEVAGPGGAVVRVTLTDACACGERHGMPTVLDLSADAFSELAPLSWGIVAVSVELVPALPATDWRSHD